MTRRQEVPGKICRAERDGRVTHEPKPPVRAGRVARGLRFIRSAMLDHGDTR
jgi:hypothetical protein